MNINAIREAIAAALNTTGYEPGASRGAATDLQILVRIDPDESLTLFDSFAGGLARPINCRFVIDVTHEVGEIADQQRAIGRALSTGEGEPSSIFDRLAADTTLDGAVSKVIVTEVSIDDPNDGTTSPTAAISLTVVP